jgi:Pregnancy-associated plasma protein-A
MPPKSKSMKRQCGTMIAHQRLLERDPGFRMRLMTLETQTAKRMQMTALAPPKLRTIKLHVHIVYNTPAENVSDAQVKSQIRALNRDFAATNKDKSKTPAVWSGLVGDSRIRFKLTPQGIHRIHTTQVEFGDDDSVKAVAPPVNPKKFLNIWVCTLAGGLLGYAQFPSGPTNTDGVVILNTGFGTVGNLLPQFNLGRTTTHEVGHYLNLHHIWGDVGISCADSDYVADTPDQEGPNYNKPSFPTVSCQNGPNGDMFMNYMDYVDDDTMVMFSAQQIMRMQATLAAPRSGL